MPEDLLVGRQQPALDRAGVGVRGQPGRVRAGQAGGGPGRGRRCPGPGRTRSAPATRASRRSSGTSGPRPCCRPAVPLSAAWTSRSGRSMACPLPGRRRPRRRWHGTSRQNGSVRRNWPASASQPSARCRGNVPCTTTHPRRRIASTAPVGTVPAAMSRNRTTGQTGRPASRSAATAAASARIASSTSAKTAATSPICLRSCSLDRADRLANIRRQRRGEERIGHGRLRILQSLMRMLLQ